MYCVVHVTSLPTIWIPFLTSEVVQKGRPLHSAHASLVVNYEFLICVYINCNEVCVYLRVYWRAMFTRD